MRWPLIALLIAGAGCGGSTDGKPIAPPTTPAPAPAPEPPPEPPGQPTGIRVADRGPDFIVWTWDSVEGATGYEAHAFPFGTPSAERPPLLFTKEPTFRADALEPGAMMGFFVRAVRETAGGRAGGPWSDQGYGETLAPPPGPLAACTNQRALGLAYNGGRAEVVHEWNPARPIRFRVDAGPIIEGGLRIGRPNFLEEEVLQPLRDMARRLEERLGYAVMESPDAGPGGASHTVTVHWRDRVWSPGWGVPDCLEHVGSPWNAQGDPPAVVLNRYLFDPAITCAAYPRDRDSETIIHEVAHVFGMGHSDYDRGDAGGLPMSEPLTRIVGGDSDYFLLVEDLDNIGCVFPHPDFPR